MAKKSEKIRKKPYYPEIIRLSLVAGVGFEPHDLRVMSPTSYQTAPSRDMIGAGSRGRTGTRNKSHGILSPGRLPIPPFRQTTTLVFLIAITLYHHFNKKSIPFWNFFKIILTLSHFCDIIYRHCFDDVLCLLYDKAQIICRSLKKCKKYAFAKMAKQRTAKAISNKNLILE